MRWFITDERTKAVFERLVARLTTEDGDAGLHGSMNFKVATGRGLVCGQPRYAASELHHANHGYGGWAYEEMYDPRQEAALIILFETNLPICLEDCWVVRRGRGNKWTYKLRVSRDRGNMEHRIDGNMVEWFREDIVRERYEECLNATIVRG